jgi:dihydropteroate synthase
MRTIKIGKKTFDISQKTLIMGILNVTPDSFSDGGLFHSTDKAIDHVKQMVKYGADIIDIGGESTRPGASKISDSEELKRVLPVIEQLSSELSIPISIDTFKSKVAEKAIDAGVCLVNDITSLQGDRLMANVISDHEVSVCLMHMKGSPRTMQLDPTYDDLMRDIIAFLKERTEFAVFNDIKKEHIIVDPGIGFGKRTGRGVEDNCEILGRLNELKKLGYPLLVGASRKTFIGNVCGEKESLAPDDRLEGSLAAACLASAFGADIIRVHDIKQTYRCLKLVDCVKKHLASTT